MRRTDREISSRERIDEIIRGCEVCHLGKADGGEPYVVPVSFGYDGRCALRGSPFEVALPEGMPIAGVVLDDQQIRTLDWRAGRRGGNSGAARRRRRADHGKAGTPLT